MIRATSSTYRYTWVIGPPSRRCSDKCNCAAPRRSRNTVASLPPKAFDSTSQPGATLNACPRVGTARSPSVAPLPSGIGKCQDDLLPIPDQSVTRRVWCGGFEPACRVAAALVVGLSGERAGRGMTTSCPSRPQDLEELSSTSRGCPARRHLRGAIQLCGRAYGDPGDVGGGDPDHGPAARTGHSCRRVVTGPVRLSPAGWRRWRPDATRPGGRGVPRQG
jgi:hypothetical protein